MRSKVTLRNKSIDNAGIPSDYKLAIAEYIWNSFDAPLFTLSGSTSRETGPSLSFQDVTLQLLGTGNVNTDSDDGGMVYFQLASDGISLDGLDIRTEQGYQLDLSRDGFIGINFNTPEPTAAVLGIFGFSLVLLRRRRKAA